MVRSCLHLKIFYFFIFIEMKCVIKYQKYYGYLEDVNNISDYLPAEMDFADINNQESRLPDDMASLFYVIHFGDYSAHNQINILY